MMIYYTDNPAYTTGFYFEDFIAGNNKNQENHSTFYF